MVEKAPTHRVVELEFSEPQLDIITSTAQTNLMHCGVGSGKTFVIGARNAFYARLYPHVRGFIGANTYSQLSKSTLVGVFKFWEEKVGWKRDIHYVVDRIPPEGFKIIGPKLKDYTNTISFANGKLIFLASLDNYKVIDGTEFGHADLDETKDTKEEAVREVIVARLRQPGLYVTPTGDIVTEMGPGCTGFNPLNIYTSPAKTEWLSEWFELPKYYDDIADSIFSETDYFRKRSGNKLVVIASTYHNKDNLAQGYIERLIEENKHSQHRINMLVYGSPIGKAGNEYYNTYERAKHAVDRDTPDNVPVHLSFDFNRVPYITLGLYKIWMDKEKNRWQVHRFDEICLEPPHNTTEHLCDKAIELYAHLFKKGIYIYGDSSGKNRRTNSNEHDYDVIFRKLKRFLSNSSDRSSEDRVIHNQSVKHRKEFMNRVFYGSLPIDYTIATRCKNMHKDCEFLREAPDGGKIKEKDKNGHEKYGHCSDEQEYLFTSAFNQFFNI